MYAALNQDKKLINAIESNFDEKYYCVDCERPVVLIKNDNNAFFRHENINHNDENERNIHRKGKELIVNALKILGYQDVESEYYLKTIKQRPDILINRSTIIEYQCAKISADKLSNRVESYHALRIPNIWILGGEYLSNQIYRVHLKFVSYRKPWGFYLIMLDSMHEQIKLFYGIKLFGPFNKIKYKSQVFLIEDIQEMFNFEADLTETECLTINAYQLEKIRKVKSKKADALKLKFYKANNQTVEDFLGNKKFGAIKPIYQNHQWKLVCGEQAEYLRQPFLNTKKEDN
ncbi:competence protein CoiA [Companilactobacillus insicii]|uniref:competence protein CoiA n=1 Tax=Companilactobacillus insicii TaxID=1732567 RepID=UPI000F7AD7A0|nr:competence protein CoiA family protein [Companilactobacillus insicii]